MLRTILLLIALLLVIGIALIYTGVIDINRGQDGSVKIETRDVEVGTTTKNIQVEVPSVSVDNQANTQ
jgi:uncharacterized protein (UPF0333 family)